MSWAQRKQEFDFELRSEERTTVHDFEEYTFRAPRPGSFLGDSTSPKGDPSPLLQFEQSFPNEEIPPRPSSRPFLGAVDALPVELLWEIFIHLDICSLLEFRRINQHAKDIVDAFPPFRQIAAFPKLLGATQALQCQSWTVGSLIRCIFDERCGHCGHFGDFLYLVTPERWCYGCWNRGRLLIPMFLSTGTNSLDISEQEQLLMCQLVPYAQVPSGYYGYAGNAILDEAMLAFDLRALIRTWPGLRHLCNQPVVPDWPVRYTAVIRAPYWDADEAGFEEGFFCQACSSQGWMFRKRHIGPDNQDLTPYPIWGSIWRRYTHKGMKEHIEQYGSVFKIVDFDGDVRYLHEKPFTGFEMERKENAGCTGMLQRCREKEIEFNQNQTFSQDWLLVSSTREVRSG